MATYEEVLAKLTAWPLGAALHDLECCQSGDVQRFTRMVDAKGRQLRTREDAIATVRRLLANAWLWEVIEDNMSAYARRAEALGIDWEEES